MGAEQLACAKHASTFYIATERRQNYSRWAETDCSSMETRKERKVQLIVAYIYSKTAYASSKSLQSAPSSRKP